MDDEIALPGRRGATDAPGRHLRWGRRSFTWRRVMLLILDPSVPDSAIIPSLQNLKVSNEIKAQELSLGADKVARCGTLLHACGASGRVEIAHLLLKFGADRNQKNYDGLRPVDLAKAYENSDLVLFLSPTETRRSVELAPLFAKDERDLVWSQRKRRHNIVRQIDAARLTEDERKSAFRVVDDSEREEWFELEGRYISQGLAVEAIERTKNSRRMF